MKKIWHLLFLLLAMTSGLKAEECDHSHGRTQNNLLPDVKFNIVPRNVTENSAVSFLAEAGRRNFRFGGTYGVIANCDSRFKISGEYLQQKIGYKYATGVARRWVRQFALGATFEQDFCNPFIISGEISAYCSYAPTHRLSTKFCEVGNCDVFRRIAGATAYGGDIGTTVKLWPCAFLYLEADYDSVIYHRRYNTNKHIRGFGGSVGFYQQLFDCVGLTLKAEFRRPFNYYRAALSWSNPQWCGLSIGVFGSHTRGKCHLPSNTMAGIEVNYSFSNSVSICENNDGCYTHCNPELACWVSDPAVYMPQVLAIAEEKIRCSSTCNSVVSTTIPPFATCAGGPFIYDVSSFFVNPPGSGPLVFSAIGLPAFAAINPVTGVITGINPDNSGVYVVVVTAANDCSTTSQTFIMTFTCPAPTSSAIPVQLITVGVDAPYVLDVVTGNFISSCNRALTFSAIGLPVGSIIDPVTGVISGLAPPDGLYTITISGTTVCGVTQQVFQINFRSPA